MDAAEIEALVRALRKPEQAAFLRRRGWGRVSNYGAGAWLSPGWQPVADQHGVRASEDDPVIYSQIDAIRQALATDELRREQW
jgi:hypothetical protein